jgi:hypothetical protein
VAMGARALEGEAEVETSGAAVGAAAE